MRFEFATATRILFGPGAMKEVPPIAAGLGFRVMVVTGRSGDNAASLLDLLQRKGLVCHTFHMAGEPTTTGVMAGVREAIEKRCELVIGIGGGSVIDTGKVIAALLTNTGDLSDYLEVVGKGQSISRKPAPYIAVPTTAGTGSEVTRNAVLASTEHRVKVSMRSPMMLPDFAVVDPLLTVSMPQNITASTGFDALTQLLEAYVSKDTNPLTDGICREGLKRAARSLRRAYEEGRDESAREDMALASLFGGLALANAKLGAVHGFAGPLGGMYAAPHGALCARLLPYVMDANIRALNDREPDSLPLKRYAEVAKILTGESDADAAAGIGWVQELAKLFRIPSLVEFGIRAEDSPTIVEKAGKASSMKGNPIPLTQEELTEILSKAL